MVNLRRKFLKREIYTQAMESIDMTQCHRSKVPQEREGGWGHLSAKSRPVQNRGQAKITKFQYK